MRKWTRVIAGIGLAFIVIGCGGGDAEAPQGPVSTAASGSDAEVGGTSTVVPTTVGTVTTQQPDAGGGTSVGVCDLVTAEELAEIFGVASVSTTVLAGPPDNCIVESDAGDPMTAWSLTTAQATVLFESFTSDPSTIDVPGIGDQAAIVQNTGLLVLKGGSLMVISISGGANLSEEEGIEASKQIGAIAAGRL